MPGGPSGGAGVLGGRGRPCRRGRWGRLLGGPPGRGRDPARHLGRHPTRYLGRRPARQRRCWRWERAAGGAGHLGRELGLLGRGWLGRGPGRPAGRPAYHRVLELRREGGGSRALRTLGRALRTLGRSLCTLGRSLLRPTGQNLLHPLGQSLLRALGRSLCTLGRSLLRPTSRERHRPLVPAALGTLATPTVLGVPTVPTGLGVPGAGRLRLPPATPASPQTPT